MIVTKNRKYAFLYRDNIKPSVVGFSLILMTQDNVKIKTKTLHRIRIGYRCLYSVVGKVLLHG